MMKPEIELAIIEGTKEARIRLGELRIASRNLERSPVQPPYPVPKNVFGTKGNRRSAGGWFIAKEEPPIKTADGMMRVFSLLGESFQPDSVRREWVESIGEGLELDSLDQCEEVIARQGEGTPIHIRELDRYAIGSDFNRLTEGKSL